MAGMPDHDDSLLSIGQFGELSRLTHKALRLYDDVGVLTPAEVDPSSGYRRYRADQLPRARLVGLLRGADVGLAEIARMLHDLEVEPGRAADRLRDHLRRIESEHSGRRLLIAHVHTIIRHEEALMFPIHTRSVPARRVLSIQRRLHAAETDAFVAEAKATFNDALEGRPSTGPFTLIFHGIVDHESDGPIEAILGCPDDVQPDERVGIRTEPAHDEAYTTITKAQWAFPAILAAYDAVGCSAEAAARPGSPLSCREVYVAEPDDIGEDDLVCDIAFPLG